jgi:hypothetical protein
MGIFSFIILNYSNKRTVLVEGKKKAATVFLLQPKNDGSVMAY